MQWREMHGTWPGSSCPDISLKLLTSSGTVTALWASVVILPLPCSLGISMLEIACDLELPSGGPNWHHLRDGHLPQEFTKGTVMDPLLSSFPAHLSPLDLSPQLMLLLSHMMHPQPEQRPTASEILQHWTLRRAVWRGQSRKAAYRMVGVYTPLCVSLVGVSSHLQLSFLLWVLLPLYRALLLLLAPLLAWRGQEEKTICNSSSPPFIGAADDSFSGSRAVCNVLTW